MKIVTQRGARKTVDKKPVEQPKRKAPKKLEPTKEPVVKEYPFSTVDQEN